MQLALLSWSFEDQRRRKRQAAEGFAAGWSAADREIVKWFGDHGLATGHGDTIVAMLDEIEWQLRERFVAELPHDGSGTKEGEPR